MNNELSVMMFNEIYNRIVSEINIEVFILIKLNKLSEFAFKRL